MPSYENAPKAGPCEGPQPFVARPGYCTTGRRVDVKVNCFKLVLSKLKLMTYSIDVARQASPDDNVNASTWSAKGPLKSQCIRFALKQAKFNSYCNGIATDHQVNLYSAVQLPESHLETTIKYHTEFEPSPQPGAKNYVVRFKQGRTLDLFAFVQNNMSQVLSSGQTSKNDILTALNIFLGDFAQRQPETMTYLKDRSYNLRHEGTRKYLGGGLEAIPGFFSGVRPACKCLLLNMNPTDGAFYKSQSLIQLMEDWIPATRDPRAMNLEECNALQTFLKGLWIKARHLTKKDDNGKKQPWIKRIRGLAQTRGGQAGLKEKAKGVDILPDKEASRPPRVSRIGADSKEVEFWHEAERRYLTVAAYFQREYPEFSQEVDLSSSKCCVVNVGNEKRPIYLPAEACEVLPGQAYKQTLSPKQTEKMIGATVQSPHVNKNAIEKNGLSAVGLKLPANRRMESFGLSLRSASLMDVEGRALETITVRYRNSSTPEVARNKSTSWNIRGMRFATPAPIKRWTYVKILDPRTGPTAVDVREAAKVATEFQKRLIHHGVMLPGKPESNRDGHLEVFDGRVDGPFGKRLKQFDRLGADLPLLLIVLPDDNKHRYERLKDLCDRAYGVRNVCAIAEKIGGCNNLQYLSNLCLKVNLKMSGINHIVPAKPLGFIEDNKTMRVGIDVTHPPETAPEGAPSVVAMVASTDGRIAQWPAELRIQEGRSRKGGGIEITTENLRTMLSVHLRRWTARHQGRLPTKILVYRDGIGESQYVVSQKELPQLQLACEDVLKDKSTDERPRITFIVCAKRHQIRFYAPQDPKGDFVKNPPASTYVDTGVTESRPWDFYLLAHESVKGTARAAHYIVLHDDVIRREAQPPGSSPANLLAKVTHNMCYLFGRCTTSVSIVPAVDYAHLACSRARFYMQDVYAGTGGPSPATLSDDTALMVWQWGLNALYWKPHDKVKDTMFYV